MNRHCANCGTDLLNATADGISSLYNPGGEGIGLCEPCWLEEDALVDTLGNNMPERLANYRDNIRRLG